MVWLHLHCKLVKNSGPDNVFGGPLLQLRDGPRALPFPTTFFRSGCFTRVSLKSIRRWSRKRRSGSLANAKSDRPDTEQHGGVKPINPRFCI